MKKKLINSYFFFNRTNFDNNSINLTQKEKKVILNILEMKNENTTKPVSEVSNENTTKPVSEDVKKKNVRDLVYENHEEKLLKGKKNSSFFLFFIFFSSNFFYLIYLKFFCQVVEDLQVIKEYLDFLELDGYENLKPKEIEMFIEIYLQRKRKERLA